MDASAPYKELPNQLQNGTLIWELCYHKLKCSHFHRKILLAESDPTISDLIAASIAALWIQGKHSHGWLKRHPPGGTTSTRCIDHQYQPARLSGQGFNGCAFVTGLGCANDLMAEKVRKPALSRLSGWAPVIIDFAWPAKLKCSQVWNVP